jgi:hypothetical protein
LAQALLEAAEALDPSIALAGFGDVQSDGGWFAARQAGPAVIRAVRFWRLALAGAPERIPTMTRWVFQQNHMLRCDPYGFPTVLSRGECNELFAAMEWTTRRVALISSG